MDAKIGLQTLSPDKITEIGMRRLSQYIWVMAVTIAADIALLAAAVSFAPNLSALGRITLAIMVIAVTAFGALGGKSALETVKATIDDFVGQTASSHYSRELAKQPMALFTNLTTGLVSLMGLALLALVWTA